MNFFPGGIGTPITLKVSFSSLIQKPEITITYMKFYQFLDYLNISVPAANIWFSDNTLCFGILLYQKREHTFIKKEANL